MFLLTASWLIFIVAMLYHFAALKIFNALVPKDAGTTVVAQDVAYGPDAQQQLDVYAPANSAGGLPIVLFVHGGSWKDGDKNGYAFVGRSFAAKGYLTLVMNYRLMPEHRYPAFIEDVAAALAWAGREGKKYGGDASRIFAVGHSAGAYNLTMAVLSRSYLDAAGFDASTLRGAATMAGPFDFLPLDTKVTIATFGQEPDLAATQPVNYARRDAPPFLLLTGTEDTTVYPKNSRALYKRLHDIGGRVEFKEYSGLSHVGVLLALAKPFRRDDRPVLSDIVAFFRRMDSR
jgi:acetyl esterase/lipase